MSDTHHINKGTFLCQPNNGGPYLFQPSARILAYKIDQRIIQLCPTYKNNHFIMSQCKNNLGSHRLQDTQLHKYTQHSFQIRSTEQVRLILIFLQSNAIEIYSWWHYWIIFWKTISINRCFQHVNPVPRKPNWSLFRIWFDCAVKIATCAEDRNMGRVWNLLKRLSSVIVKALHLSALHESW